MKDDIIKRKNDLMKSIMGNQKLSKSFRDAMIAPIGSTKREHIKSTLAIMKKLGGLKHDGMGGPVSMGMPVMTPPSTQSSSISSPNYANMIIFPAAPKFKVKQTPIPNTVSTPNSFEGVGGKYDGKGGILDNTSTPSFSFDTSTPKIFPNLSSLTIPAQPPSNSGLTGNLNSVPNTPFIFKPLVTPSNNLNLTIPSVNQSTNSGLNQNGNTLMTNIPKTNVVTPQNNTSNTALSPGQFNGPVAPETSTLNTTSDISEALAKNPNKKTSTITGPVLNPTTKTVQVLSPGDQLKIDAQKAVNQGTGSGMFAMGVANDKFGGSLDQYIANLDDKLKKDFNLEPLEKELSNLKSMKNNLVPTLKQYITGKDQYLKFIDSMIDSTQDDLLKVDMSDPASVDRYNNYMNYLTTLKGRQTQRYGNFLNSAISDYNADLENTQSNYDNVYKHYNDAITRQGTIAQNEYNTLYTTMADLYNNLEQAPIKRANLEALQLQNEANRITILKNGLGNGQTVNPDYWKDVKTYSDMITSKETGKEGALDLTTLTDKGLAGYYNQNLLQGGDEAAMTEAIRRALSKTLETSSDPATVTKVKTMINDLANNPDPGGAIFASAINNSIAPTTSKILSNYILGKIGDVKSAANSLVKGSSGYFWTGLGADKPGIQDKETWMKNNSSLDKDFLENLYNAININVGKGTAYEKKPSEIIDRIFSGSNDQDNANNLANIIAVSS